MAKKSLAIIIVVIAVGGAAFYGGMKYTQSRTPSGFLQADLGNLRNLSPEERQQRFQEFGAAGRVMRQAGTGLVNGEIIAKDEQSISVKFPEGGSKIVFYSSSTKIIKSIDGTGDDLKEGTIISISGKENSDGSYTATDIRIGGFQQGE